MSTQYFCAVSFFLSGLCTGKMLPSLATSLCRQLFMKLCPITALRALNLAVSQVIWDCSYMCCLNFVNPNLRILFFCFCVFLVWLSVFIERTDVAVRGQKDIDHNFLSQCKCVWTVWFSPVETNLVGLSDPFHPLIGRLYESLFCFVVLLTKVLFFMWTTECNTIRALSEHL